MVIGPRKTRSPRSRSDAKKVKRQAFLVLGMHRSGTSSVAGTLVKLGVSAPKTLLGANLGNERGHFESEVLIAFHDELLASAGSRWDDWRPFRADWYDTPVAAEFKARGKELLRDEFGRASVFVLKDPRICRFLRFWLEVFEEEGIEAKMLLPLRSPLEVAQSHRTRDHFPIRKGLLLWLRHVLDAETASRDMPRALFEWDAFLQDWRVTATRLETTLGVRWPALTDFSALEIDRFLSHDLKHESVPEAALAANPELHVWVIEAYEALRELARNPGSNRAREKLDALRKSFDDSGRLFGSALAEMEVDYADRQAAQRAEREASAQEQERLRHEYDSALLLEREARAALHEEMTLALDSERQARAADAAAHAASLEALAVERDAKAAEIAHIKRLIDSVRAGAEAAKATLRQQHEAALENARQPLMRENEHLRLELANEKAAGEALRQQFATDLGAAEVEIRELSVQLSISESQFKSTIEELQDRISVLNAEIAHKNDTIKNILVSTSWRATRPLRLVSRLITQPKYVSGWAMRRAASLARALPWPKRIRNGLDRIAFTMMPANAWPSADAVARLHLNSQPSFDPKLAGNGRAILSYVDQVLRTSKKNLEIDLNYVNKSMSPQVYNDKPVDIIAFYLPQFHPLKENNEWWGDGFTEWTNVSKAVPQFLGHYQPHLPGELGFYDLRLVDVMRKQVALAKHYGIGGFCFHFYWFGGRRLLELPINNFLENRDGLDFPFCFCWANENWTRRWDGQDNEILIGQVHSAEDDIAFIDEVIKAFRDPRYIRYEGRPLLVVYRVSLLPDAAATAQRWRERCREVGIGEIYLVAAKSFEVVDPRPYGFDAAIEFPPHQIPAKRLNDQIEIINPTFAGNVYSYDDLATGFSRQFSDAYPLIKTVVPSWDNEARKPGAGHVFFGSSPQRYGKWLDAVVQATSDRISAGLPQPPFVFCNAWNEWAEGAHLEPDRRYGYAFLHATAASLSLVARPSPEVSELVERSQKQFRKHCETALAVHLFHEDLYPEIQEHLSRVGADIFVSLPVNASTKLVSRIVSDHPLAYLTLEPNRGRDILPFIKLLRTIYAEGYSYVCKIHSKKSPQRKDGAALRQAALTALLGEEHSIREIRRRFENNSKLGIVAPADAIVDLSKPDRNVLNRAWLNALLPRIGADELIGKYNGVFVAGSMFWARVAALKPILDLELGSAEFESEAGQVDGTLAHAIERLWSIAAQKIGFVTESIP